jgi:hypothetical protein
LSNLTERNWFHRGDVATLRRDVLLWPKKRTSHRGVLAETSNPPQSVGLTSLPNSRWPQGFQIGAPALSNCAKYPSARRIGGQNWLDQLRGFCNSRRRIYIVRLWAFALSKDREERDGHQYSGQHSKHRHRNSEPINLRYRENIAIGDAVGHRNLYAPATWSHAWN